MTLPDLKFKVGADPAGVKSGVGEAKKEVKGLESSMADMATKAVKAGAMVAAGFVAIKAAVLAAGVNAAKTAVEIDNLARVANAGTTEFQKMAAGARSVGVEQEQLAGMLKDVNDRVGEFISTGAGPMSDFFTNIAPKVGVTADQFARLSGPEALQLYVSSLEKAGLSQQQMTFYMEGFSGDLTKLLPLLRNGGAEMTRLGNAAEASGRILSEDMIRGGKELDQLFADMADTLRTSATKAILEHKDELISLANWISDTVIPAMGDLFDKVGEAVTALQPAIEAWGRLGRAIAAAAGVDTSGFDPSADTSLDYGDDPADTTDTSGSTSTTGTWPLDENGNVIMDGGAPLVTKPVVTVPGKGAGSKSKGGGGGKKSGATDLDRIREQYATEQELLDQHLADQLAKLEEFKAQKLASDEELSALELKIREEYHNKSKIIEDSALQARLAAWSSAFGALSSLMSTNNKKLFKVGKVAAESQAIVDGLSAVQSAFTKGMIVGGPAKAYTYAGLAAVKSLSILSQIRSTEMGSGGGSAGSGGGGGAGGGGTGAAAALPVQRVDLAYDGPASMQPGMQALVETLNNAAKAGYRVDVNLVSKR